MHAHKCQFHGSWESLQRHDKDVVCVWGGGGGRGIGRTVCGGDRENCVCVCVWGIGRIVYVCMCVWGGRIVYVWVWGGGDRGN